jgi:hypothetical protein
MNMPDFKTYQERDDYFREHAHYFTVIKKDGVGGYARDETKTLEQAEKLVKLRQTIGGGNFLIYAVIGEQSAFVKAMPAGGQIATIQHTNT